MKVLSVLCLCFILLCSCARRTPEVESATLRLSFSVMPPTFDPRKSGDFSSATLVCLIYEGLMRCLPGGDVEHALAKRVEISPDGLTYTFYLRRAFWTDGHPVRAIDFEKSWKQILDPAFSSLCSYLLFPIKNAEKYTKGEAAAQDVAIYALNDNTLRVELENPTPYFLSLTAFPLFLPVPSHLPEPSLDVCNGPFHIASLLHQSEICLQKNPKFWNASHIALDAIHISIIPDDNTALELFEQGMLDWIGAPLSPLPLDALVSLQEKYRLHSIPMAASTFLAFNTTTPFFQNVKLRKALSYAIDREKIVRDIGVIGQIPAQQMLPPSLSNKAPRSLYDTQNAQTLFQQALDELGIRKEDLEKITLYYKSGQVEKRLAQALQRAWKSLFGFSIQLQQMEPKTHMETLHQRTYQIAIASWIAQFHDPINLLERYRLPSNRKNFAAWENSSFQDILAQVSKTCDEEKRLYLLQQAEEILAQEIPVSPLYHWTGIGLSSARLESIPTTPAGGVLFERVALRDAQ